MILSELIESIDVVKVSGKEKVEITSLAYDSRTACKGGLFIAVPGEQVDGADYIADAVARGVVAVVSECVMDLGRDVTHVQVANAREALADLANAYYGQVSKRLLTVGVTGTNGKTTTSFMIRDILRAGGFNPGLLGTVAYEMGSHSIPATRTTPEALEIHSMLHHMDQHQCRAAVLEVSSHAISMDRVRGIDFNVGVFTNLTQDHLDFHGDMEAYFETKARFFECTQHDGKQCAAVVNVDDPCGQQLLGRLDADSVITYGFSESASVRALDAEVTLSGTRFHVETPWGCGLVSLKLLGRFNVHNALAALAVGGASGIDFSAAVRALEELNAVPGRLEEIPNRRKKKIFVDYAHTDDALKNVLMTLREICTGRLLVVFGCGGNRDQGKRFKMGRVASELADYAIITSDNPRSEDPGTIADHIMKGFEDLSRCEVVLDRRDAIAAGIEMMQRKDILLVAGKGHEIYQEFNGTIVPFDDRETVREFVG